MATLTNRDIVVRNPEGRVVLARVRGQNIEGGWMKCLAYDGEEFMAQASDFVRVAAPSDWSPFDRRPTIDLLERVIEFIQPYVDVRDGSDGQQLPNKAMVLSIELDEEILRLKRCSGDSPRS